MRTTKRWWMACALALTCGGCMAYDGICPAPTPGHYYVTERPRGWGGGDQRSGVAYVSEYRVGPDGRFVYVGPAKRGE